MSRSTLRAVFVATLPLLLYPIVLFASGGGANPEAPNAWQDADLGRTPVCNQLRPLPPAPNEHFTQDDRHDPHAYAHTRPSFTCRRAGTSKIHGALNRPRPY